jgi:hypothetical protein
MTFKSEGSLLGCFDGVPGLLTEGAGVFLLGRPATDAVGVIGVIAGAPTDEASLTVRDLIGLALETGLVDGVFANGAVLDGHIPAPQSHRVPLLHLDALINLHLNKEFKQRISNLHCIFTPASPTIKVCAPPSGMTINELTYILFFMSSILGAHTSLSIHTPSPTLSIVSNSPISSTTPTHRLFTRKPGVSPSFATIDKLKKES